jgi:DNA-binding transcriptional ArsR family regulator
VVSTEQLFAGSTTEDTGLSKDDVFSLLSNRRRRLTLHYLRRSSGTASVRDLSKQIAAWENGVGVDDLNYKQRKRVYTSLHQTHLPKLDDSGVVEYDRDRGTVTMTDLATELDPYLDRTVSAGGDESWPVYYLGLAGLAAVVVACAWAGLFPFSLVPDIAYAALLTLALAVSASLHTYHIRDRSEYDDPPPCASRPTATRFGDGDQTVSAETEDD